MKTLILVAALTSAIVGSLATASAQTSKQGGTDGPILGARAVNATAGFTIKNPAGSVRLVGWGYDSIVVRGRVAPGDRFAFVGDASGMKIGMFSQEAGTPPRPSHLVIYLPKRSTVTPTTVTAPISATDVSGVFTSVSGSIQIRGSATSVEAASINGGLDIDVAAPWVHAHTGQGHVLIRGTPQDVDAATIGGTLDIASPAILRGRFASVSGDIHYAGQPAWGGIFEFSNHSGAVDFLFPRTTSARLELSSVVGLIENGFDRIRPIAAGPHSLRLSLGRGDAQITVRTFKGVIRLRPE